MVIDGGVIWGRRYSEPAPGVAAMKKLLGRAGPEAEPFFRALGFRGDAAWTEYTGGCLCGDVRIVATGRPYRVGLCHCLDCRKHHGALFHASAIFPQDAVTI